MDVLSHHIYEYKKGLRNLVLHTMHSHHRSIVESTLNNNKIDYIVQEVNEKKINIFFGNSSCVNVIKQFGNKSLSSFSPEEDFVLGIMLGYDRLKQCDRLLERTKKAIPQLQNMLL